MRTIESKMVAAVRAAKNWRMNNTEVEKDAFGGVCVYLHGNLIWQKCRDGQIIISLRGWNTATTRSRLRALGIDICSRNFTPCVNGVEISSSGVYMVSAGEVQRIA